MGTLLRFVLRNLGLAAALGVAGYRVASRLLSPPFPALALEAGEVLTGAPRRVLALSPGPGFLEQHLGGTLCLLSSRASSITVGLPAAGSAPASAAGEGEEEGSGAASLLGYREILYLEVAGGLPAAAALQETLAEAWDQSRPDTVFAPDPRGPGVLPFPGRASPATPYLPTLGHGALAVARRRLDERVSLYLYATPRPNVLVDVTPVLAEKARAVQALGEPLRVLGAPLGGGRYAERLYRVL